MYLVMRQDRSASRVYLLWGAYVFLQDAQETLAYVQALPSTAHAVILTAPEWTAEREVKP